jgi:hypothetical protein
VSSTVREPARDVPVADEVDVLVVGGSATGVFAAVAAARLGARAAVIERQGFFGGTATAGLVAIWHGLRDTAGERPIIGGLTREVIERLNVRDAVEERSDSFTLNTEELKIELDRLVVDAGVRPFLNAWYAGAVADDGRPVAALIQDKSGRRAVRARCFIDASGDGDLIRDLGLPTEKWDDLQPPTTCARFCGLREAITREPGLSIEHAVFSGATGDRLPLGFLWSAALPGLRDIEMVAGTRVRHADCSDADQLTQAEIEGRRQARVIHDILRERLPGGREIALDALPASIGVRETRHARCLHRIAEAELLGGARFRDAIANGTYRVDIHHSDKPGLTFRYLNGREVYLVPGRPAVEGRWRKPLDEDPTFYQVPYRCLVPQGASNVLVAGRLIDADRGAYAALRVMVNCNQFGEAAGTAAALALQAGTDVASVDTAKLRQTLADAGSIVI